MGWGSVAGDVIDALVQGLTTDPDIGGADVAVRDGPVVTGSGRSEAISIGFEDQTLNVAAIEGQFQMAGAYVSPTWDNFIVNCAIQVVNNRLQLARARAYQLLGLVGQHLVADHTVGGLVMNARIGDHKLLQRPGAKSGVLALLIFGVDCQSQTRN